MLRELNRRQVLLPNRTRTCAPGTEAHTHQFVTLLIWSELCSWWETLYRIKFKSMICFLLHDLLFATRGVNGWTRVVWIAVMFLSAVWLSFWRHPFTAVEPWVSKWWMSVSNCIFDLIMECWENKSCSVWTEASWNNNSSPSTQQLNPGLSATCSFGY